MIILYKRAFNFKMFLKLVGFCFSKFPYLRYNVKEKSKGLKQKRKY